jgi:hypothetical protein
MAKNNVSYLTICSFPEDKVYTEMVKLYSELFIDADLLFFKQRIKEHPKLLSVLAYGKNQLIGFKVGYPYDKETFYSWIGGVLPNHGQQGIGTHMAKVQEDFARSNGYKKLRTKSMNTYKVMMILNLKNGFDITSVYTNTKNQTKIVFEKQLT